MGLFGWREPKKADTETYTITVRFLNGTYEAYSFQFKDDDEVNRYVANTVKNLAAHPKAPFVPITSSWYVCPAEVHSINVSHTWMD